jgi:hypothetical protein
MSLPEDTEPQLARSLWLGMCARASVAPGRFGRASLTDLVGEERR